MSVETEVSRNEAEEHFKHSSTKGVRFGAHLEDEALIEHGGDHGPVYDSDSHVSFNLV